MTLYDEGSVVPGRTCPQCQEEQVQLFAVTDEAMYLCCLTCGCVWHETEQRTPLLISGRERPPDSARY